MREIKLKDKDLEILAVISGHGGYIGPTKIGETLGKPYDQASAYCTSSLGRLIAAGKIIRMEGKYKIK